MRVLSRLLLVALLLPVSLLLGMSAEAGAQETHEHMDMPAQAASSAAHRSRWSDPASWPDGKVPRAGDAVTIGRDRDIVLDVNPPALRSLTINGKLSFSNDLDIELKTDWIYLPGGELDIGSEAKPYTRKATITLTDNVPDEEHQHHGGPRDHDVGRHVEPARRPHELLDQARQDGQGRQHQDRSPECQRLAEGRRDRPCVDRLRSPPGGGANRRRHSRKRDHARSAAEVHALRQDHLRRRRAWRSRPADAEHPHPRFGRRGEVLLRRAHHGDGRVQDVRLRRRTEPHGAEHAPGPVSDPLAHRRRRPRASTSRTRRFTTPTAAA